MNIILLQSKCAIRIFPQMDFIKMIFTEKWRYEVLDLMSRMGLI